MKIVKDFSNTLLKRRELEIVITDDSNPGHEKVMKGITEKFKVKEEVVVVKSVKNRFGDKEFKIDVLIYKDVEGKNLIEKKKKKKKKKEGS